MIRFYDVENTANMAQATLKRSTGVNGSKTITGEIIAGNAVINGIGRGWSLVFEDEPYIITYTKFNDQTNSVEFDAIQKFFWDFAKSGFYQEWNGSHAFTDYLDALFKNTGYEYILEANVAAFEKENWGMKNRLALFNDVISQAGVEFELIGKRVKITNSIGSDLSTIVRKGFNLSDMVKESSITDFVTYGKGFGAFNDSNDQSKGRLEVEYRSPLADIYGVLESDPLVDERYTIADSLLAAVKSKVDNSVAISIDLKIYDLPDADFTYQVPQSGDWIMAIDEAIGFSRRIRIINVDEEFDVNGQRIDYTATCGDLPIAVQQELAQSGQAHKIEQLTKDVDAVAISANGKNSNYYGSAEPSQPREGDLWYKKNGDDTELYVWANGRWEIVVSKNTSNIIDQKVDSKLVQLNADISTADENLKSAKQDIADLQVKLKDNDDTQSQLTKDLSENSTILEKARADIVANANGLTELDAKLKANDDAQAQLQDDLAANTKVQDRLKKDLSDNTELMNQVKTDTTNSLEKVNNDLAKAQDDAAQAVKHVDKAVANAKSSADASGLSAKSAQAASDAALAAKELATSTSNSFEEVKSQSATAASNAATALNKAKDAVGNASDALSQAKSALSTANSVQTGMQPAITTAVDKAKGELSLAINTVQSGLDGLSVGGRNLLYNSKGKFQPNMSRTDNNAIYFDSTVYMTQGQQYTVHADASSGLVWSGRHNANVENNNVVLWLVYSNVNTIISDENTGTGTTFTWNNPSGTYYLRVNTYKPDNSGYVENVKIEKGNVATDWSPAPEDVQSQITTNSAQITASSKLIAASATQESVNTLTQQVTNNTAQLKLTATEADLKLATNAVDALTGRVTTAEGKITATSDALKAVYTKSETTNLLGEYATQTWAQNQIKTSADGLDAKLSQTQTQLDGISIGGTNLLTDSGFESGNVPSVTWGSSAIGAIAVSSGGAALPIPFGKYMLKIESNDTSTVLDQSILCPLANPILIKSGETWTYSYYYASAGTATGQASDYLLSGGNSNPIWGLSMEHRNRITTGGQTAWHRFTATFTATTDITVTHIRFGFIKTSTNHGWLCIDNIKLEQGNIATDWSPAPEDAATYTETKVAELKLTVDGFSATFAKQTDLEKTASDFKVTADGLNLLTTATGKKGEKVTQVIADVKNIKSTMTGANGYTTRLQTLEGFQTTATDNIKGIQTQQTTLAGQYTSLIESTDNKVRTPWFDDGQIGTWNDPSNEIVSGSNTQELTGHSNYLKLFNRNNYEGGVGWFSVTPGEVYYFSGYMGSWGTTYPVNVGLNFITEDGNNSWIPAAGFPANSKTLISAIAGSITVPAGVVRARTWVQIDGPQGTDLGYAAISGLRISKSASSSQITQLQDNIDLRVKVDNKVTAALSLSADGGGTVTIRGASLYVTADSHFDDASIQSASIASLDATKITSGSISSDRLATTKLNADNITSGSISAERIASTDINADNITSGYISTERLATTKLNADNITSGSIDAERLATTKLNADNITSGSIATALLASTKINADNITSGSIAAERLAATKISATNIVGGTFDAGTMTVKRLSADMIATGTLDVSKLTAVKNFSASNIIGGTLDASTMTVKKLSASSITGGTIDGTNVNVIGLNASAITTGTITGANLAINLNSGEVLFTKGSIKSTTGTLDIEIEDGTFSQRNNSGAGFLMSKGNLYFSSTSFWEALDKNEYALSTLVPDYGYLGFGDMIATKRGMALYGKDSLSLGLIDTRLSVDYFDDKQGFISIKKDDSMTVHGGGNGLFLVGGPRDTGTAMPTSPYIRVGSSTDGKSSGNRIYTHAAYIIAPSIYEQTTGNSSNVVVLNDGSLHRSTSASKYKTMIERSRSTSMAESLIALPTAHWLDKAEIKNYANGEQSTAPKQYFGMIAEDLAGAGLEELVQRGDDGELEGINYDRIAPALLPLLAKMKQEIEELKGEK